MHEHLVDHVDLPTDHVHAPDVDADDLDARRSALRGVAGRARRCRLQLLGIGSDGHVGFNEPGSSLRSRTRIKTLTAATRADNARFFDHLDDVPRHVMTQGLATIGDARHLVLHRVWRGEGGAGRRRRRGAAHDELPGVDPPVASARHGRDRRGGGVRAGPRPRTTARRTRESRHGSTTDAAQRVRPGPAGTRNGHAASRERRRRRDRTVPPGADEHGEARPRPGQPARNWCDRSRATTSWLRQRIWCSAPGEAAGDHRTGGRPHPASRQRRPGECIRRARGRLDDRRPRRADDSSGVDHRFEARTAPVGARNRRRSRPRAVAGRRSTGSFGRHGVA